MISTISCEEPNNIVIDEWIKETVSGTKTPDKRKLGSLLERVKEGDLIICAELSRLGRSLLMIMSILNQLMKGDDIQSKVLAFAFGLSAEIERDLISQWTKEALALRRMEGVILGRPIGKKSARVKLTGQEKEIERLIKDGYGKSEIGRMFCVNRMTVDKFMRNKGIR